MLQMRGVSPYLTYQCEGWELNPRIPSEPDLKSGAFDHSTTLAKEMKESGLYFHKQKKQ